MKFFISVFLLLFIYLNFSIANDGILNSYDNDRDNDGILDAYDNDRDNDGILDAYDMDNW